LSLTDLLEESEKKLQSLSLEEFWRPVGPLPADLLEELQGYWYSTESKDRHQREHRMNEK